MPSSLSSSLVNLLSPHPPFPAGNTGQLQPVPQAQVMLNALQSPAVFSDDRDVTLMKFNHLQAYCGTGKGLASYMGQPQSVDFTPENPFCRFKVSQCLCCVVVVVMVVWVCVMVVWVYVMVVCVWVCVMVCVGVIVCVHLGV